MTTVQSKAGFSVALGLIMNSLMPGGILSQTPDPERSWFDPADALYGLILIPAESGYSYNVRVVCAIYDSAGNPLDGVSVTVDYSTINNGMQYCVDSSSWSCLTIPGGWCYLETYGGSCDTSVSIKANSVTMRTGYSMKSPDWNGSFGDKEVDLGDAIYFSDAFNNRVTSECHDYDNNGDTTLFDLIVFGDPFVHGARCD